MIFRRLMMLPRFNFAETIQSVDGTICIHSGHKPPAFTDTPSGRYAGSLFTAASKSNALQIVADDMTHLQKVLRKSGDFR